MTEHIDIAGYCRISVDEELDRDNVSIENQKAIITDFVKHRFPDSTLTFYEDRDRSGYRDLITATGISSPLMRIVSAQEQTTSKIMSTIS